MTDLEILRKAADLMRQRAKAASLGRWRTHGDGLVWAPRLGDPVAGATETADAEHIAGWDPVVGLSVAGWLTIAADDLAGAGGDRTACGSPGEVASALAVARTYLRVEEVSQ